MRETWQNQLRAAERIWLVTGVAGFIGSNLLEWLLKLEQRVVGLDNFSTGRKQNLDEVRGLVSSAQWKRFQLIEGNIQDVNLCQKACRGVNIVLHQAALGSVPGSLADPIGCHASNVTGFINMLEAARDAAVGRFVYASSCAVYGDDPVMPKQEDHALKLITPYAASKAMDEIYAYVFSRCFGFDSIGLRYFNIFGPRQDPQGAYAAVIPKWIASMLKGDQVFINGDGETSRDFCFVENVVQANLLAGLIEKPDALNQVYNIGLGKRTTLNELYSAIRKQLTRRNPALKLQEPGYRDFRAGDLRDSVADIRKAKALLDFAPTTSVEDDLAKAMAWYEAQTALIR